MTVQKENDMGAENVTTTDEAPRPSWEVYEPKVPGETSREARQRRERNTMTRLRWNWYVTAKCAACDQVRFHVSHEMDAEHSAEGPEYHAEFAHHPFVEVVR